MATRIQNIPVSDVQADEIWTFCGKKQSNRKPGETGVGDAWTFIGIERHTKLVLDYHLSPNRRVPNAVLFAEKLPKATAEDQKFQLTSDGLSEYNDAVGTKLDGRCDYGQLVKIYRQATTEELRPYSPARLAEAVKTDVYGDPDFDLICTSHVERQNGSLRQW